MKTIIDLRKDLDETKITSEDVIYNLICFLSSNLCTRIHVYLFT